MFWRINGVSLFRRVVIAPKIKPGGNLTGEIFYQRKISDLWYVCMCVCITKRTPKMIIYFPPPFFSLAAVDLMNNYVAPRLSPSGGRVVGVLTEQDFIDAIENDNTNDTFGGRMYGCFPQGSGRLKVNMAYNSTPSPCYRMAGNIGGKLLWRLKQNHTILFPPSLILYDDA